MNSRAESDPVMKELLSVVRSLKQQLPDSGRYYVSIKGEKTSGRSNGEKRTRPEAPGQETLEDVRQDVSQCRLCSLCETRRNVVFGEGDPQAKIVFVGEAPGADEDAQGLPFVGRAGQLLTNIIKAMGLERKDVYICNILKCRPPGNRNPQTEEIRLCEPYLKRQLKILSPRVICALGTFSAQTLLAKDTPITALRGRFHDYEGIPLMPTYHPAYLLRNSSAKKPVWEDIQKIMREVGIAQPEEQ